MNNIEALLEQLGSLQITEEVSNKYEQTTTEEMLTAPAPAVTVNENGQVGMPKNIVPDPVLWQLLDMKSNSYTSE